MERILSHYSADCEITTTMIKAALGIDTGKFSGKESIKKYWEAALTKIPGLHFELVDATLGVENVALYYKSVMGKKCMEIFFLTLITT